MDYECPLHAPSGVSVDTHARTNARATADAHATADTHARTNARATADTHARTNARATADTHASGHTYLFSPLMSVTSRWMEERMGWMEKEMSMMLASSVTHAPIRGPSRHHG
jgi:hypothetical protein